MKPDTKKGQILPGFPAGPKTAEVGPSSTGWDPITDGDFTAAQVDSMTPGNPVGRILVVDDEEGIRYSISQMLSSAGHQVSFAENGEDGWNVLRGSEFDVLITDYDMPRLTGLELLRRLRAIPGQLPAILMSGRMPLDGEEFLRSHPPGLTMTKPFSQLELLTNIERMLV